ncbi:MAG: TldD/PmbA family protein [Bacteroidetes bacterium]|nr:MAG: TldD/PmbA family protein [Bacteroidota bacterium]
MTTFADLTLAIAEAAPDVLRHLLGTGGTWADLFVEQTCHHRLARHQRLRGGRLHAPRTTARRRRVEGAGLRVLGRGDAGFAATDDVSAAGLIAAATNAARRIPYTSPTTAPAAWTTLAEATALPDDAPDRIRPSEKAALLEAAADAAFALDERVCQVEVRYHDRVRRTLVATSSGVFCTEASLLIGLRVAVTLRANGRSVTAHAVGGGACGFGHFFTEPPEHLARTAVEQARQRAAARPMSAGTMPVVLAAGWGGVWLHEAVGHLLEADVVAAGRSPLAGWEGGAVAGEAVTLVDDPTWPDGRGSMAFDDEGTPATPTTLIERGILRGLLTDRLWADHLDRPRTGNARRQDYRYPPLPRMTNLLLQPGDADPDALIAAVADGLYVEQIGHGVTHPDGRFAFDVVAGRRIEAGRLTHPVAGVQITGTSLDALAGLVGIARDPHVETARGLCKKAGQVVPISVGMPTVLIEAMTVAPAPTDG